MVTNQATLTDGTRTVTLTVVAKPEADSPAHIAEIPIPGRTTGGQVQFLGSPQWKFSIIGILNKLGAGHTDDMQDFEPGGFLELIKNNTTADCTLTYTYNGTQLYSITTRIVDFVSWPIKGAAMPWFGYTIKLLRKQ
jgi:hypothetical protein